MGLRLMGWRSQTKRERFGRRHATMLFAKTLCGNSETNEACVRCQSRAFVKARTYAQQAILLTRSKFRGEFRISPVLQRKD